MRALCEFIADKTDTLQLPVDNFLISGALNEDQSQADIFTLYERTSDRSGFQKLRTVSLESVQESGAPAPHYSSDMAVVIPASFQDWGRLREFMDQAGVAEVDIVFLVPTGAHAMSQAALAQFATETSIRAQAFGFVGTMGIANICDTATLGIAKLARPIFATSLGEFIEDLSLKDTGQVAVLTLACRSKSGDKPTSRQPMFTVLTRTQGTRMETLAEVLLCMSAQTIDDFEHLIIAHNAKPDAVDKIQQLIDDQSTTSRARIRFEQVLGGTRTTPLNAGFAMANGKYVIILDDDDIAFANWLETFRGIAAQKPGSLLRAVAVRQEFTWAHVEGKRSARAISAMHRDYASTFDFLEHLEESQTPPISIAFPRYLFTDHDMRFDETLTTTEDWDYIMRCATRVGVGSAEEITCIYRWWVDAENSRTVHSQSEWIDNHHVIQKKIDTSVNLLEAGTMSRIREVSDKMNEYLRWANKLHHDLTDIQAAVDTTDAEEAKKKIALLSKNVQGEITTMLSDVPSESLPLVPPQEDMLPPPRLTPFQKLMGRTEASARARIKQRRDMVEASGIFDAEWYVKTYPDVATLDIDPLGHFVQFGSRELRSPSAQFNARSYYATNADLRDHRIEPVFHFLLHGKREGRRYERHD